MLIYFLRELLITVIGILLALMFILFPTEAYIAALMLLPLTAARTIVMAVIALPVIAIQIAWLIWAWIWILKFLDAHGFMRPWRSREN